MTKLLKRLSRVVWRGLYQPQSHPGNKKSKSGGIDRPLILSYIGFLNPQQQYILSAAHVVHRIAHLSTPAHAIMTPLSVHHLGGGRTSERPSAAASFDSSARMNMFEATPPATTRFLYMGSDLKIISLLTTNNHKSTSFIIDGLNKKAGTSF